MAKRPTITVSDEVYEGLCRRVGTRRIGEFPENFSRSHVIWADLEAAYREMARDEQRERETREGSEADLSEGLPDGNFSRPSR